MKPSFRVRLRLSTAQALLLPCLFTSIPAVSQIKVSGATTFTLSGALGTDGTAEVELPEFKPLLGQLEGYGLNFGGTVATVRSVPDSLIPFDKATNWSLSTSFDGSKNFNSSGSLGSSASIGSPCGVPTGCDYYYPAVSSTTTRSEILNTPGPGGLLTVNTATTQSLNSGSWSIAGKVGYSYTYYPKTTYEYTRDLLALASHGSNFARGTSGYEMAIGLRESSAETSGQNLALRDAEYFFRGYAGGAGIGNRPIDFQSLESAYNDIGNRGGPIAAALWNGFKIPAMLLRPLVAPDALPFSPPGGIGANYQGWIAGVKGEGPEEAIGRLNGAPESDKVSTDVNHPTVPKAQLTTKDGSLDVFYFEAPPALQRLFLDPPSGNLMVYGITGNSFSEIYLPSLLADKVFLLFGDRRISVIPGQAFSFMDYSADGISGFALEGFGNYSLSNAPITIGIGLVDSSPALITAFSSDHLISSVPEPSEALLFFAGMLVLACCQKWKRSTRHSCAGKTMAASNWVLIRSNVVS
jgi:hypothetical protein